MATNKVPVYSGVFGREQAERLLWRAGFGPRAGEAEKLASMGLQAAVKSLTRPSSKALVGPAPRTKSGETLAPRDVFGHDQLWWMDKMLRTQAPLHERLTLIFHDWFATSTAGVGFIRGMLEQNETIRHRATGSFKQLTLDMTRDGAMLIWLSGAFNIKGAPNENYARELMELFTLGAGRGYTEQDVREQARALSGFTFTIKPTGFSNFRFKKALHDSGIKKIFGKRGRFDYRDVVDMCIRHPKHPSFFVNKLWSYFIPTPPNKSTQAALERLYKQSKYNIMSVVESILLHPDFYTGPRMVKPPVVYTVGMLKALDRPIDDEVWAYLSGKTGQILFQPPNVSGWDDDRWIDTSTFQGRWLVMAYASQHKTIEPDKLEAYSVTNPGQTPQMAVDAALAFWGNPTMSSATRQQFLNFATNCDTSADADWKKIYYPGIRQNALRALVGTCPDYNTC